MKAECPSLARLVLDRGRSIAALFALLAFAQCSSSASVRNSSDASAHAGGGPGTGGHVTASGGTSSGGGSGGGAPAGGGGTPGGSGAPSKLDATVGPDARPTGIPRVYVSGYGGDITEFTLNQVTAQLSKDVATSGGTSPSYLAIAPDKRHLYAINEADAPNSKVVAFSIDPSNGHLTEIGRQDTGGSGAPHLSVHPSGKWLAVAHYTSGHTSILPILADGTLGAPTDVKKGPNDTCGKAHQAVFDSTGAHLFVPCLDSNYVIHYLFTGGTLSYGTPATVSVTGGPRHMAFDPSETHAYVISETDSIITSFLYDKATGTLSGPQTIQSYEQTKGSSAQIVVHPGGRWLYASNRTENSIGLFSIDAGGRPHPVKFETNGIATPRDFSVDPNGALLISTNQDGDQSVLVYRISSQDGTLSRTQIAPVGGNPTFTTTLFLP